MRQIEFTLVYNRKKSLNKNGEALIQVCCYRMGVRKYFSTGIYIKPEEWNDRKQIVNHYREDYEELNERLEQKLLDLKTKIKLIKEKGETATLRKLKEVKDEKIYTSFYDFMEDQIEKELGLDNYLEKTRKFIYDPNSEKGYRVNDKLGRKIKLSPIKTNKLEYEIRKILFN